MWWKKKIAKVKLAINLKEQQRIAKGLEYVTDDSVSFSRDGKKVQLTYSLNEYVDVSNGIRTTNRYFSYYYWDLFFLQWMRACGHAERSIVEI